MIAWQYRNGFGASTDLIELFRYGLDLCQLKPDEQVMVYGDHHSPAHYASAFIAAAKSMGADVFQITIPTYQPEIMDGPIWNIWHEVDLVVDLESISTSVYRPMRVSALRAGTRVLRISQPEDILFRLRPSTHIRDRVLNAEQQLSQAREMHITSASGTDLTLNVAERAAFGLWGAPDKPGKWDHWSVAVVVGGANRERSNGCLVINAGDIILGMQRYATSQIEIYIEEGVITRIVGGFDATLLRHWFEKWDDPRAYWISHVGWGCDDRADWNRMASKSPGGIGDAESFPGVFQIAFGRDTSWYIGGGTNDVPAHIDFNCLGHSISLDDAAVTEAGNLI